MANSTKEHFLDDAVEMSDSEESFRHEEFRHMITRTDWLEVYKKRCQEEKILELENKSGTENINDLASPITECISISDDEYIPVPNTRRGERHKNAKNATESASPISQKGRRGKRQQGTTRQAVQGKGRNRRSTQSNSSEDYNPEIVFLSDDESSEISVVPSIRSTVSNRNDATNSINLDDSIEVIYVSSNKDSTDVETDEQNREINVIFHWQNMVLKLPMKMNTQFGTVLSQIASSWEVPGPGIMLLYNDEIVKAIDTPGTYEMLGGTVIECSIVKSRRAVDPGDPNVITIKLQTKNSREKKSMAVHQMAQFQSIIEQFAKEEGLAVDKIIFKFDGDTISPTDTVFGLGIEDNFAIDVIY